MTPGANDSYSGNIPAQGAGVAVEFYIKAIDALVATSRWPQATDARALLEFEDNRSVADKHNIRIIMTPSDWALPRTGHPPLISESRSRAGTGSGRPGFAPCTGNAEVSSGGCIGILRRPSLSSR